MPAKEHQRPIPDGEEGSPTPPSSRFRNAQGSSTVLDLGRGHRVRPVLARPPHPSGPSPPLTRPLPAQGRRQCTALPTVERSSYAQGPRPTPLPAAVEREAAPGPRPRASVCNAPELAGAPHGRSQPLLVKELHPARLPFGPQHRWRSPRDPRAHWRIQSKSADRCGPQAPAKGATAQGRPDASPPDRRGPTPTREGRARRVSYQPSTAPLRPDVGSSRRAAGDRRGRDVLQSAIFIVLQPQTT